MVSEIEKTILLNIIKHCSRVEEKMAGVTKDVFLANRDIIDIVCFNIFQIGELAKNLSKEFLLEYDGMPWKSIKGMRDRVGHGYGTIDFEQAWTTASQDIKPLREYCEEIVKNN